MSWFDSIYKVSLILTLGVLVWYTMETKKIRIINNDQLDLQLLPAIMIYFRKAEGAANADPEKYHLAIRNIGKGTATSIKVHEVLVKEVKSHFSFSFDLETLNNTLVANEERLLNLNSRLNDRDNSQNRFKDFHRYFSPYSLMDIKAFKDNGTIKTDAPTSNNILVSFKDIKGQEYATTIHFSYDGISILTPPNRV